LKIHIKHLNKYFHKCFLMTAFVELHRFLNFNNIKNIVYFDVPNHCI
jgi:hypothetical protein